MVALARHQQVLRDYIILEPARALARGLTSEKMRLAQVTFRLRLRFIRYFDSKIELIKVFSSYRNASLNKYLI